MKGNISYNKDGALRKVKMIGVDQAVSLSFRKFDSSIRLIIKTKIKNINDRSKIFFENFLKRYFL